MTEQINVLIVDDEPLAQELLETYVNKLPGFKLVGKCNNALEAFSMLNKVQCDLLLLDINMPELTGIDFLKTLKNPPQVIFTTAYSEFAVESYELNAVDYLLKPITFNRFLKAMQKVSELHQTPALAEVRSVGDEDILFVKSDGKMVRITLSELWFVEGLKNYVRLWTEQGKVIVHSTMKNFEDQLAAKPLFLRINKSYIVNMKYITEIDGNAIRIKGESLTIGNTYRDEVHKVLERYNLL